MNVYIEIADHSDGLSQEEWSRYVDATYEAVHRSGCGITSTAFSLPTAPYRQAVWRIETSKALAPKLQGELIRVSRTYHHSEIAWCVLANVEKLGPYR